VRAAGASMTLRLAFMGTPDFAVPVLEALRAAGHALVAVYSRRRGPPDAATMCSHRRSSGRRGGRIEVRTPRNLDALEAARLRDLGLDAVIVVAYGLILPQAVLTAPRLGCINVHASLLPRWRGAAPIQRAILAGDSETGVTIMQMDQGLDTGRCSCAKGSRSALERPPPRSTIR